MISYGLEAINPYNGHQRREREGESEEQERGARARSEAGDIIWA